VKQTIFVELFEQHEKTTFYTIRFQNHEESETELFLTNFDTEIHKDDIDIILAVIDKIGEQGAKERYFRPEGGCVKAIPLTSSGLRLYLYRINDEVVILGNGGQKQTATYQEDPVLNKYVETIRAIGNILNKRLEQNHCQLYNRQLMGNLKFNFNK
jgi:hypothetical protein